ncbi:MAG: cytidylate kinase [Chloroflexi bacterium HGW-Chloroflexi-10]|nr:MAG: cytidylate kinase [Chloroflexi bacterium HGW-Chloroflexi-10]
MKPKYKTIALDGPAASGKSTLGERLADTLGYIYLDTGVMYRAVTLAALKAGIDINNEILVTTIAENMDLDVRAPSKADGRSNDIILAGQDVTWEIRQPNVESNVSQVSAYRGVRVAMTAKQREIGKRGQIVMVGRDIGTVVLPDADLKIYLDASVEERAKRRFLELVNRGKDAVFETIMIDMQRRDQIDSTRSIAPLKPAVDAKIVNSDQMTIDEVYQYILEMIVSKK